MEIFKDIGVDFKSLNDHFDTNTVTGRLIFQIIASIAEFERELIRERTKDALASLKARGKKLGPKMKDFSEELEEFRKIADKEQEEVMKLLVISRSKYFRLKKLLKKVDVNAN